MELPPTWNSNLLVAQLFFANKKWEGRKNRKKTTNE